jgi:hypothetical protein
MAADVTLTGEVVDLNGPTLAIAVETAAQVVTPLSGVEIMLAVGGSGGSGPPPRPTNGFLYPRGDY